MFEHKRWPIHNAEALDAYGNGSIGTLALHFSSLEMMSSFDLNEAKHQWRRVKRETAVLPFFKD